MATVYCVQRQQHLRAHCDRGYSRSPVATVCCVDRPQHLMNHRAMEFGHFMLTLGAALIGLGGGTAVAEMTNISITRNNLLLLN